MTQQSRENLRDYFVRKMMEEEKEDTRKKGFLSDLVHKYKQKKRS